jgi:hypothetical protein
MLRSVASQPVRAGARSRDARDRAAAATAASSTAGPAPIFDALRHRVLSTPAHTDYPADRLPGARVAASARHRRIWCNQDDRVLHITRSCGASRAVSNHSDRAVANGCLWTRALARPRGLAACGSTRPSRASSSRRSSSGSRSPAIIAKSSERPDAYHCLAEVVRHLAMRDRLV